MEITSFTSAAAHLTVRIAYRSHDGWTRFSEFHRHQEACGEWEWTGALPQTAERLTAAVASHPQLRAICADYGIEPDGEEGPIMAIGGSSNADLILNASTLGYLNSTWETLDCTYGLGRFWRKWSPDPSVFRRHDLNPEKAPDGPMDFTALDYPDGRFNAVVFDPPYKLSGTSTGAGPSASDADYGVEAYRSVEATHNLARDGIRECLRVLHPGKTGSRETGGFLLVKCQAQVASGRVHWQPRVFADFAEQFRGVRLVDMFHLPGHRAQPKGRPQVHARQNYSTLLVLRKESR